MIAATNGAGVPVDDTQTGAMALEVAGLHVNFHTRRGTVEAATDVDLHVRSGEVLALLGESGSGKSVTARAIMGLLRGRGVEVGADVLRLGDTDLRGLEDQAQPFAPDHSHGPCLLYTSPSPRDLSTSRMPSSA